MLRQEFLNPDSNIHKMTAEEVYASNKAVFGVYPLANFKTNFASLKDKVARDGALAAAENKCLRRYTSLSSVNSPLLLLGTLTLPRIFSEPMPLRGDWIATSQRTCGT
jgi:hypothetical protein